VEEVEIGQKKILSDGGDLSDAQLVQNALVNPDDFKFIIERYEKKLLRYLLYFTGLDRSLAEDILQETMIKVYRNLNGFKPNLSFSSWIYRIAHNEALNFIRKNKKQAFVSLDAEDEDNQALLKILASEENIPAQMIGAERAGKVREILAMLKDDFRELLILRYLQGYDYQEISAILKKPLGSVGVLIGRAKEEFKAKAMKFNLLKYE